MDESALTDNERTSLFNIADPIMGYTPLCDGTSHNSYPLHPRWVLEGLLDPNHRNECTCRPSMYMLNESEFPPEDPHDLIDLNDLIDPGSRAYDTNGHPYGVADKVMWWGKV
jgi:hypothetical protein